MLLSFVRYLQLNETALDIYLGCVLAVMVLPMAWLMWFYHREVGKTEGGRKLMEVQNENAPRGRLRRARDLKRNDEAARAMASGIEAGDYGEEVRALQRFAYKFSAVWLLANALIIGVPLYGVAKYGRPDTPQGEWE